VVCSLVWEMPSGRTNNFPWKWAWPSVTFSSIGNVGKSCFRWCTGDEWRLTDAVVCVIANVRFWFQHNLIFGHIIRSWSKKSNHDVAMSYHNAYLTVEFCILDSLGFLVYLVLWGHGVVLSKSNEIGIEWEISSAFIACFTPNITS